MMCEYADRLKQQTELARAARDERGAHCGKLTLADCMPDSFSEDLTGKIVILCASTLRREYQTADHQLIRAVSGFGCKPGSGGRAAREADKVPESRHKKKNGMER